MTLDESIRYYDNLADYDCYNDEQRKLSEEQFQVAEWLRELKRFKEQQTCNDVVSRQMVKEQMLKYGFHAPDMTVTEFVEDLPPTYPEIIKCEDCIHNGSFDTDCPIRWPGKEYYSFAEGKEDLDCNSCEHQDEVDGSNCYECVKGIHNNYKAESDDKE